jgi:hypothetical protein
MEPVFALALFGLFGVGLYHLARRSRSIPPRPSPDQIRALHARAVEAGRRRLERATAARRQQKDRDAQSHRMQTALIEIAATPDFRRAATLAAAAKLVPAEFRRRQFHRFRPSLVAHYRRCATKPGCDAEILRESLRDLAVALGVAEFEADYIATAAQGSTRPRPAPTPTDRMAELKRDHDTRVAAIRDGLAQSPELQEQLLESEEGRYRQALEAFFEAPATPASVPPL